MKHLICLTVLACLATASNAETITVCADETCDHVSIQNAIDSASDGDLIMVGPGTYPESIDFLGKAVRVESLAGAAETFLRRSP